MHASRDVFFQKTDCELEESATGAAHWCAPVGSFARIPRRAGRGIRVTGLGRAGAGSAPSPLVPGAEAREKQQRRCWKGHCADSRAASRAVHRRPASGATQGWSVERSAALGKREAQAGCFRGFETTVRRAREGTIALLELKIASKTLLLRSSDGVTLEGVAPTASPRAREGTNGRRNRRRGVHSLKRAALAAVAELAATKRRGGGAIT